MGRFFNQMEKLLLSGTHTTEPTMTSQSPDTTPTDHSTQHSTPTENSPQPSAPAGTKLSTLPFNQMEKLLLSGTHTTDPTMTLQS
jgi:hypothetical protein